MSNYCAIVGLLLGSFYNVVGMRLPKGESMVAPPSRCDNCGRRLSAWELVPVVSWLVLRGRCRSCGARVSVVYPLVEMATGIFFALVYSRVGLHVELIAGLFGVSVLVVLSVADLHYQRIPNKILYPSIVALIVLRAVSHPLGVMTYLEGAALGFGVMFLIALISRGGMGFGDVKLFFFVGLLVGLSGALMTLFLSSLIGTLVGLSMRVAGKLKPRQPFPFGPSIGLATILVYLYGGAWLSIYLHWL